VEPSTSVIDTSPVDLSAAIAIEGAEARAWTDLYAAAPADWAEAVGLDTRTVAGALVSAGRPRAPGTSAAQSGSAS
jgi:hypothetical protein